MFMFEQTSLIVLIYIIGILQLTIGLTCYSCEPCRTNTDLGTIKQCHPQETYCGWGERELENGTRFGVRMCATAAFAESDYYSCDKFTPRRPNPKEKMRVCSCQSDLCNGHETSGGTSPFPSKPLLYFLNLLSVSVVVFVILTM